MSLLTATTIEPIIRIMTDWLTCAEASQKTGYNARHLQRLCKRGKLDCVLKGRVYLINPQDLDRYIREMKSLGTAKHDPRRRSTDN